MANATVTVDLNGAKNFTTDKNGQIKVDVGNLAPKTYAAEITFKGNEKYMASNTTAKVTVNKIKTKLSAKAVTATYNINKYLVVVLKDADGNPISGAKVSVNLGTTKTYKTNAKGQIKVPTKSLAPKKYAAQVTFQETGIYAGSTAKVSVVVKKAPSKLAAKKKTYRDTAKNKRFYVVLKDSKGKAIKKAKVAIKVKGKKYYRNTNSKGVATFNLKLSCGKYVVGVGFAGNKYYNKAKAVKVKVTVKTTFKTVFRGSKDAVTVKKIQKALKKNGFYKNAPVDGIYNSVTEKAVKLFQKAKKLKVTGKVDYNTAKKLRIVK